MKHWFAIKFGDRCVLVFLNVFYFQGFFIIYVTAFFNYTQPMACFCYHKLCIKIQSTQSQTRNLFFRYSPCSVPQQPAWSVSSFQVYVHCYLHRAVHCLTPVISLYMRIGFKFANPVESTLVLIMFSTLYGIRLVSTPWFAMSLDVSDLSRNDASSSALSEGVPSVAWPFIMSIFPLDWVDEMMIRVFLLALWCLRRQMFSAPEELGHFWTKCFHPLPLRVQFI